MHPKSGYIKRHDIGEEDPMKPTNWKKQTQEPEKS